MRIIFISILLFTIVVGNSLQAAQEAQQLRRRGYKLVTINSLICLQTKVDRFIRKNPFGILNDETSAVNTPIMLLGPKIINCYLSEKMRFKEKFDCISCRFKECACNKETLAEYIQNYSFQSYKNLSDQLLAIYCLERWEKTSHVGLRKGQSEIVKYRLETNLEEQLHYWITKRRQHGLKTDVKQGFIGLTFLGAACFLIGYCFS